jgi:hypothetical protein
MNVLRSGRPGAPVAAVVALVASVLLDGCGGHEYDGIALSEHVPERYLSEVESSLDLAGENGTEILHALTSVADEDREALAFLVAELPPVDLAAVDAEFLLNTVVRAREASELFPWGADIPRDVYLHYVLPPRVSQEPLEDWRRYLLERLRPRIGDMTSMEEAALEVNRWCGEHVGFRQTQRRDQGVFETLASGYGRCEEMMIVHIAALRSVGIPARQAWTPYWATCDNNHAWTEVWVDGRWHYTGACEPRDCLDDAWFNDRVKDAPLVLSAVMGSAAEGEDVYREKERYSLVNSTANYAATGRLSVHVSEGGGPASEEDVTVSVWNFGALRAIARLETDTEGAAGISLGRGAYFVCGGGPSAYDWRIVQVEPGGEVAVDLALGASPPLEGEFWLRTEDDAE